MAENGPSDNLAALLKAEGLVLDADGLWVRPDPPGTLQPEVTEYGTTVEAVDRLLGEARSEAEMAWDDGRNARRGADALLSQLHDLKANTERNVLMAKAHIDRHPEVAKRMCQAIADFMAGRDELADDDDDGGGMR